MTTCRRGREKVDASQRGDLVQHPVPPAAFDQAELAAALVVRLRRIT